MADDSQHVAAHRMNDVTDESNYNCEKIGAHRKLHAMTKKFCRACDASLHMRGQNLRLGSSSVSGRVLAAVLHHRECSARTGKSAAPARLASTSGTKTGARTFGVVLAWFTW